MENTQIDSATEDRIAQKCATAVIQMLAKSLDDTPRQRSEEERHSLVEYTDRLKEAQSILENNANVYDAVKLIRSTEIFDKPGH